MLLRPIKWVFSIVASIVLLWVFFFVPIGSRTLFDHVKRIAGTREARDLGNDIQRAGEQVYGRARDELRNGFPLGAADGGAQSASPSTAASAGPPTSGEPAGASTAPRHGAQAHRQRP